MPSPKLKAQELIEKFQTELSGALYSPHNDMSAKACARICVEEIIVERNAMPLQDATRHWRKQQDEYWNEVLTHL